MLEFLALLTGGDRRKVSVRMAKILDGTALAQEIRGEIAVGVAEMRQNHQVTPGLGCRFGGRRPGLSHICSQQAPGLRRSGHVQ